MDAAGADGCGLFRTEFAFMTRSRYPDVADPGRALPRGRSTQAGGRPVDVPHARHRQRQAPALLAHAARGQSGHGLAGAADGARPPDHPARPAAGAASTAAAGRQPAGHVPDGGRGRRAGCRAPAARYGAASERPARGHEPPSRIEVGAMVEVPSLLLAAQRAAASGSTSSRSAATTCSSSCSPATGATLRWPTATTSCRRPP